MFFDITITQLDIPDDLQQVTISIFFDEADDNCERKIGQDSLLVNCVPVVNLFTQQAEPIRIEPDQLEYAIVADNNVPLHAIEVYAVNSMTVTQSHSSNEYIEITPYFGKKYRTQEELTHLYWHTFRKECWEIGEHYLAGTEMYVIFSEIAKNIVLNTPGIVITPNVLCTNRETSLLISIHDGAENFQFYPDDIELITSIQAITKITKPRYRNNCLQRQMDFLTYAATNLHGFYSEKNALELLKNILRLFNIDNKEQHLLIEKGLCDITISHVTKRLLQSATIGFLQGIEYALLIDEKYFPEQNAILFALVLQHFLQNFRPINSFIKLKLKSKQRGLLFYVDSLKEIHTQ